MVSSDIDQRNKQIMLKVAEHRKSLKITRKACADALKIGYKRYRLLETGHRMVWAAELEALLRFLGMSYRDVEPDDVSPKKVVVKRAIHHLLPGEELEITVIRGDRGR